MTDLRSSPLINQLQKYVANLHMDYDRAVHEKIQMENIASTVPRRSVSPATVIEQADGPALHHRKPGA